MKTKMHRSAPDAGVQFLAVMALLATTPQALAQADPKAGSDVTPETAQNEPAIESTSEQVDRILGVLARFPQGEWRTMPANGYQQRDVWSWGPTERALTSITSNSEGTSESVFGSFRVIYHHPQRDELAVLALCGPGLVQTGVLTAHNGSDFRFDMTLFYDQDAIAWAAEPTRTISSVWSFDTPTSYTNFWIEDQGRPVDRSMTGWPYARRDQRTPLPASATTPPEQVAHLGAFVPLVGSIWQNRSTRTTFDWIPYDEAILMRTHDTRTDDLLAETIFYPHPHTKAIHTLTLHNNSAVDEGIATIENGEILIRAERADQDRATRIEQRIERLGARGARIRTWSTEGTGRTLLDETALEAVPHS